jgi:SAM-dependent methyltransferase
MLARVRRALRAGYLANTLGYLEGVPAWQRLMAVPVPLAAYWRDQIRFSVMAVPYRRRGRLLDVGCGVGDLLAQMTQLGWQAEGVEIDPAVIEVCRARGLTVHKGTLYAQHFPDNHFDAVTAKHVVEHMHDPCAFLRECARILKPGGQLVMLTPNLDSLGHQKFRAAWMALEAPRHLVIFTRASLQDAAARSGLRVVRAFTTARPSGFIWRVSSELRKTGASAYLAGGSRRRWVAERAYDAWVRLAMLINPTAGDELAIVATKD